MIFCAIEPELGITIGRLQRSICSIIRNKTNKCLYKYVNLLHCQLHNHLLVSATFREVSSEGNNNNNNDNNNKLKLGYHPVAVVILHVHKYEKKSN